MNKNKGISSLVWDMTNLFSNQIVRFILSIYLARLLEPREFGVVGMAMVYITISNLIMGFGFSASIVNKDSPKETELSTIFYLNLAFGLVFSVLGFFGSPYIGEFYGDELVGEVFQVLSLIIFLKSLSIVQNALLIKAIDFKAISIIQMVVNIITAILGIFLAYLGYGVWSLVIMNITREFLYTVSVWMYSKWKPLFYFNLSIIKDYLNYGKNVFLSAMITGLSNNLDTLLIGKFTNATSLGFYTRSRSFEALINNFTGRSLGKVLFPIISKEKDPVKIDKIYWSVFKKVVIIVFLLLGILYSVGEELFIVLFTEKWRESIPIFKILIIGSFYQPLNAIFKSFIKGIGNSKMLLKSDILKTLLLLITFIPLFWGNITIFLWLFITHHFLAIIYNFFVIGKFSKVSFLKSILFFLTIMVITFLTGLLIFYMGEYFSFGMFTGLFLKSLTFGFIFLLLIFIFFNEEVNEIKEIIKGII